eukprot:7123302-Pyramimonas_sp.AAC.1
MRIADCRHDYKVKVAERECSRGRRASAACAAAADQCRHSHRGRRKGRGGRSDAAARPHARTTLTPEMAPVF